MDTIEENLDHLETGYIYLTCTPVITNGGHKPKKIDEIYQSKAVQPIQQQNFAASPRTPQKAVNSASKTLSRNDLYECLSEENKRAIVALGLSVDTKIETVLEQLLFAQVAGHVETIQSV